MDAAFAGLIGALVGAVTTGAATYFGPLRLQKRKELIDAEAKTESQRAEAIRVISQIRVDGSAWLTYLLQVTLDVAEGRSVDLAEFDEKSTNLRVPTDRALAAASNLGHEIFYSRFAQSMRDVELRVRRFVASGSAVQAVDVLRETNYFEAYFTPRQIVTTHMIDDIVGNHWANASSVDDEVFAEALFRFQKRRGLHHRR